MAGAAALAGMMGGAGNERAKQNEAAAAAAAEDNRLAKQLAQQQSQYDTTLAENKNEFGKDYGLRSTAAGDAHNLAANSLTQSQTLFPIQVKQANANLASTTAGTAATKAATAFQLGQNAIQSATKNFAIAKAKSDAAQAAVNVQNSVGDTVAHRDAMQREAEANQREIAAANRAAELDRVRLEASLRVVKQNNPQMFMEQVTKANTAAAQEAQKLFAPSKPGEKPMLSDPERAALLQAASAISSSTNPLQAAFKAIQDGTTIKGTDDASKAQATMVQGAVSKGQSYLMQLGLAAQMTREAQGGGPGTLSTAMPSTTAPASGAAIPRQPVRPRSGVSVPAIPAAPAQPAGPSAQQTAAAAAGIQPGTAAYANFMAKAPAKQFNAAPPAPDTRTPQQFASQTVAGFAGTARTRDPQLPAQLAAEIQRRYPAVPAQQAQAIAVQAVQSAGR